MLLGGKIELTRGDAKDAIIDFRSVLKAQPDSVEVISLLTKAHLENREPQLARDTFDNAVSLYPDKFDICFARANFLAALGDYDGALKDMGAVLAKDPKNTGAMQTKAEIYAAKQDRPDAEANMNKVKEALPNQPIGYYQLGTIYQAQKKFDKAATEFELALQKTPQSAEALMSSLVLQGKADQALARINQAIQAMSNNATAYTLLGSLYANQKRYVKVYVF